LWFVAVVRVCACSAA